MLLLFVNAVDVNVDFEKYDTMRFEMNDCMYHNKWKLLI